MRRWIAGSNITAQIDQAARYTHPLKRRQRFIHGKPFADATQVQPHVALGELDRALTMIELDLLPTDTDYGLAYGGILWKRPISTGQSTR